MALTTAMILCGEERAKSRKITLSKKGNATNLAAVISYVLLIGPRVLGNSFIRHVIDLFGVFYPWVWC